MNVFRSRFLSTATLTLSAIVFVMISENLHADELGRLFTTKQERIKLERLRQSGPEESTPVVEIPVFEPDPLPEFVEKEETPEIGGITLKGVVHRKNGNSTAWINSGNTYEGDIGNQYITVDPAEIDDDNIRVSIPYSGTSVKIKVGQTYVPTDESVEDVVDISGN